MICYYSYIHITLCCMWYVGLVNEISDSEKAVPDGLAVKNLLATEQNRDDPYCMPLLVTTVLLLYNLLFLVRHQYHSIVLGSNSLLPREISLFPFWVSVFPTQFSELLSTQRWQFGCALNNLLLSCPATKINPWETINVL